MPIRSYQPDDEVAQVAIYNAAAASLPGFKPATADEVARRYRAVDADPAARFYAVEGGAVVGYAVFNPNGRISYPWCLPAAQSARRPLLDAVLDAMRSRGHHDAWAAYRDDWGPVLSFLRGHGFGEARAMINYVADLAHLPDTPVPADRLIRPWGPGEFSQVVALGRGIFASDDRAAPGRFSWDDPPFDASSLFATTHATDPGTLLGAALLIGSGFADPTKVDGAMPCFRLGAMGTEGQRHKRVSGLFSCVFADETAGEVLIAEAVRRLGRAGLTHLAAQAPSDHPALVAFYNRFLRRQGSFPILKKGLSRV